MLMKSAFNAGFTIRHNYIFINQWFTHILIQVLACSDDKVDEGQSIHTLSNRRLLCISPTNRAFTTLFGVI